jgi:uncharacterized membrane-anchored protein YhcB (DUF1043 family)
VYPLELVIIVGIVATIVGTIIGYLVAQKTGASSQTQAALELQLEELQKQQQNYQNEVSDHFVETAQLFNQLTNSYRDVHNHLAGGAQKLAGESATNSLAALSDESQSALVADNQENDLTYRGENAPEIETTTINVAGDEPEKNEQEQEPEVIIARETDK